MNRRLHYFYLYFIIHCTMVYNIITSKENQTFQPFVFLLQWYVFQYLSFIIDIIHVPFIETWFNYMYLNFKSNFSCCAKCTFDCMSYLPLLHTIEFPISFWFPHVWSPVKMIFYVTVILELNWRPNL